jgi:uncharacterized membrane protein YgcG
MKKFSKISVLILIFNFIFLPAVRNETASAIVNLAPVANAGPDQSMTLPTNSVNLDGSASIDPDGSIISYAWAFSSGPAMLNPSELFAAFGMTNPTFTGLVAGTYVIKLTVTDNLGGTAEDTVEITVNPSIPNVAPDANAGADQSITLPTDTAVLDGNASTDSDGTISSYVWNFVSGPTSIDPTDTVSSMVGPLSEGTYQFELIVTDNNGATDNDQVQITVNPAPGGSGGGSGGSGLSGGGTGGSTGGGSTTITPPVVTTTSGDTNTGGSNVDAGTPPTDGKVLGAETSCGAYISKFLKKGRKNDAEAVKKLQQFLNSEYPKAKLKVDGKFSINTEKYVKKFQTDHSTKVLVPWGLKKATGIVYLTTVTEINNISCPTLALPIPTLVPPELNPDFPQQ